MAAIVELVDVTKRYATVTALSRASLAVEPGTMYGLIGPDGAGKTTTIRLMAGLLTPDGGSIRVAGHDPVRNRGEVTARVGYLSQRFSLYGDLSIDENVAFFAEIHGVTDFRQRRDSLLALTQLTSFRSRLADRLSGGMKQKLALVCTLVHEPELLLLDEPTTGVDPVARREFWKLLSELLSRGLTIVMATPYLDEAERCQRVALLHDGRVLAQETPADLRRGYEGAIAELVARPHRLATAALDGWTEYADYQTFGERIHVRLRSSDAAHALEPLRARLATTSLAVDELRLVEPTLEDVFIDRLRQLEEPAVTS
ncbi:MAG: ABC transporter ATP-binding protein [Vicinamibacterales bacterium]